LEGYVARKFRRPNRIGMGTADENVEIRISDSDEWQRIARYRVANETRGHAVGRFVLFRSTR
jgi:hypothetical protein